MREISIKRAAMINASASYSCVLLQLVFNGILARMLSPDDYGIVTVVSVFTTFFTVMANMGIGPAVIQNKELTDEDISNIFSFNFYAAIVTMLVFAVFSIPLSKFYGNHISILLPDYHFHVPTEDSSNDNLQSQKQNIPGDKCPENILGSLTPDRGIRRTPD